MPVNETCIFCVHYNLDRTCDAFPKNIPDEIWNGQNRHTKVTKRQSNTIVFKRIEVNGVKLGVDNG